MPEYLHPGVYVQEESSGAKPIEGASTSTTCFVGETSRGRPGYPTFVTSWLQFERAFGSFDKSRHMPLAVYQFFQNGGRRAYIVRVLPYTTYKEDGTTVDRQGAVCAKTKQPLTLPGAAAGIALRAAGAGKWADGLQITVVRNKYNLDLRDWKLEQTNADNRLETLEEFKGLGGKESGDRFYASVINRDSNYLRVDSDANGSFVEWRDLTDDEKAALIATPEDAAKAKLEEGSDGNGALIPADYAKALHSLDRIDDASILAVPGSPDRETIEEGIAYVESRTLRDMIYVIDSIGSPRDTRSSEAQINDVKELQAKLSNKSSYAALYFPWVEVADPFSKVSGATRLVPPSGMIAGLYARTDNTRGVWKAPAGTEASLVGAVGLAASVSDGEQDTLNPIGVNCIRQFPASGIVVWGSRTLATQRDPEYRYVPIRRTAIFLKTSLFRGTQWVVFEPNDEPLWSSIRFNINAFMQAQFRAGAFQGAKPADAYFVKCDHDNNIQATIDAGQVHIMVAFAPLKPAEFVIIHIQQMRKE